jgi:hypothetical protein
MLRTMSGMGASSGTPSPSCLIHIVTVIAYRSYHAYGSRRFIGDLVLRRCSVTHTVECLWLLALLWQAPGGADWTLCFPATLVCGLTRRRIFDNARAKSSSFINDNRAFWKRVGRTDGENNAGEEWMIHLYRRWERIYDIRSKSGFPTPLPLRAWA